MNHSFRVSDKEHEVHSLRRSVLLPRFPVKNKWRCGICFNLLQRLMRTTGFSLYAIVLRIKMFEEQYPPSNGY